MQNPSRPADGEEHDDGTAEVRQCTNPLRVLQQTCFAQQIDPVMTALFTGMTAEQDELRMQ